MERSLKRGLKEIEEITGIKIALMYVNVDQSPKIISERIEIW
jgi:hypothetical protein